MKNLGKIGLAAASVLTLLTGDHGGAVSAAAGLAEPPAGPFRVLAPIASGNLLLFPVVRDSGKSPGETLFLTLDEGLKSGQIEVTEAGRVRGLVRPRSRQHPTSDDAYRGDQVNTFVLVNNSSKPLLLLAGEIVTGGKQDRVIAKDRIVPAGADPIDLSVFCIEPGRWTESSASFSASSKASKQSFMVQPTVRQRAMVEKDQQQVWDSVHGAISQMEVAAAPPASAGEQPARGFASTTSYAKVMQNAAVSEKVGEASAPVMRGQEQVLAQLHSEHAIGMVVAVHGEIVWADLFASTDLLSHYWTKLVRSYAAESLIEADSRTVPSVADAQHFLDAPSGGRETSEGEVGVYRYRELKTAGSETFVLESLLPGANYDVHLSKMKVRRDERRPPKPGPIFEPQIYRQR